MKHPVVLSIMFNKCLGLGVCAWCCLLAHSTAIYPIFTTFMSIFSFNMIQYMQSFGLVININFVDSSTSLWCKTAFNNNELMSFENHLFFRIHRMFLFWTCLSVIIIIIAFIQVIVYYWKVPWFYKSIDATVQVYIDRSF